MAMSRQHTKSKKQVVFQRTLFFKGKTLTLLTIFLIHVRKTCTDQIMRLEHSITYDRDFRGHLLYQPDANSLLSHNCQLRAT